MSQRPGAAGPLDRGLGAPARDRLLRLPSSGRVSALTFMILDEEVVALSPSTTYRVLSKRVVLDRWNGKPSKGNGLRSAGASAPTLAYGYLVLESGRVLLPVLVSGWCESGGGSLGDTRVDDGSGCGVHLGASEGAVPGCAASNHLGQRSSASRRTSSDVHPHLRDDAREDGAVLPAIERKDRTLAQDDRIGCPASCEPLEPRRGSPIDGTIRRGDYNGVRLHSAMATLRRWTSWLARPQRSGRSGTGNWSRHESRARAA